MIDREYQEYINEQSLDELKKISFRINKMHFPEEFSAVVKRIEELEGDSFDRDFYFNDKMKDALHLEVKAEENFEERNIKSKRILSAFLYVFAIILSINVYNLIMLENYLSIVPVIIYVILITLNIQRNQSFGKATKIWAVFVVIITLISNFSDKLGLIDSKIELLLTSLIGSNHLIDPTKILIAVSVLIFFYTDHIIYVDDENEY